MRRLLCSKCGDGYQQHPEDVAHGFQMRRTEGLARKPVGHGLDVLLCDLCRHSIPDGAPAVAVTVWRENPIGYWEAEYLTPPIAPVDPALQSLIDQNNEVALQMGATPLSAASVPSCSTPDSCRRCNGRQWIQPVVGQPERCPECNPKAVPCD
ncbi:MAG: hypothetical protein PHQ12_07410 [Chthoniobacteraceae bacterium]|nr:hypothetical protein [Chthoniobacteraceae bacterium]